MLSKHATELRYRKTVMNKKDVTNLVSTFTRPLMRLRRHLSVKTILYSLPLFITITSLLYYVVFHVFDNHLMREEFLETHKCPACYGTSMCFSLANGEVKFSGTSKLRFLDAVNSKNVHFGTYGSRDIVLKKLAFDTELRDIDAHICRDARRDHNCDVGRVVHLASYYQRHDDDLHLTVNLTRGLNDMLACPTARLLNRIKHNYKERSAPDRLLYRDKIMLLTTLRVNPEPIIIQTFPASEGWPFPEYFGACGRFILQSYCGNTLDNYFDAPFHRRLDLAYQIIKMADRLSDNEYQFAIYWSDLQYENFAVDKNGTVTYIDMEHLIVVDQLSIKKEKNPGWDEYLQSEMSDCEQHKPCISMSTNDLCTHADADHNYFAACVSILSPRDDDDKRAAGLLHDMPDYVNDDWELGHLLRECASPTRYKGRAHAKQKLLYTLNKLRVIHLYKNPEKFSAHMME